MAKPISTSSGGLNRETSRRRDKRASSDNGNSRLSQMHVVLAREKLLQALATLVEQTRFLAGFG